MSLDRLLVVSLPLIAAYTITKPRFPLVYSETLL